MFKGLCKDQHIVYVDENVEADHSPVHPIHETLKCSEGVTRPTGITM